MARPVKCCPRRRGSKVSPKQPHRAEVGNLCLRLTVCSGDARYGLRWASDFPGDDGYPWRADAPMLDLVDRLLLNSSKPIDDQSLTFRRIDGGTQSRVIYFLPWCTSFRLAYHVGLIPLDYLACYEMPSKLPSGCCRPGSGYPSLHGRCCGIRWPGAKAVLFEVQALL